MRAAPVRRGTGRLAASARGEFCAGHGDSHLPAGVAVGQLAGLQSVEVFSDRPLVDGGGQIRITVTGEELLALDLGETVVVDADGG